MKSNRVGLGGFSVLVTTCFALTQAAPAYAKKNRNRNRGWTQNFGQSPRPAPGERFSSFNSFPTAASSAPQAVRPQNAVNEYLSKELKVDDLADYNMTVAFQEMLQKLPEEAREAARNDLDWVFSEQSAPILGQIFRTFGRTSYNNPMVLGPAGVGKSFLINQLVALFSYGHVPQYLRPHLAMKEDGLSSDMAIVREALLGKADVVLINTHLLSQDNTKSGKAMSSEPSRMNAILVDIFKAANEEFLRSGRRTIFIFDEVATLPDLVQKTWKKILDKSGFKNPHDPIQAASDAGYMALPMTTLDEYRAVLGMDSANERRFKKIIVPEPTEEEAFRIVRKQSDRIWEPLYGTKVSDEAIRFFIRMRRILHSPPLAMPASILAVTNDFHLFSEREESDGRQELTLRDAQRFVMKEAGLGTVWFSGPNGEPPFHDFADQLKKKVIGQDEVIDKVAERLKAWARLGFGGDVPVFFLGGSSGSGKDTLLKALNEVMFGHDGRHMMFSIGGISGFGIESIVEGPPRGNHADGVPPLVVQAADNGPKNAILAFNEAKDAPSAELEKLKVFIELGEVRPKGKDSRVRPLQFPIFIMGQYGEELFDVNPTVNGRALTQAEIEAEIVRRYASLTQDQIEAQFLKGKDASTGKVSPALLNRAKRTGGIFLLAPVATRFYGEIVKISLERIRRRLHANVSMSLTVSDALVKYVADTARRSGEGTRGLDAVLIDFTETAISRAIDHGLPIYNSSVSIDCLKQADQDLIVVKNSGDGKTWAFDANKLRRTKICEAQLQGR